MPTSSKGRIRKCILNRRKLKRAEVLRILAAAMENADPSTSSGDKATDPNDFYNTGRVGRRNALPDILSSHSTTTTTADLPDKLKALTTDDKKSDSNNSIDSDKPSTSQSTPSTSSS